MQRAQRRLRHGGRLKQRQGGGGGKGMGNFEAKHRGYTESEARWRPR